MCRLACKHDAMISNPTRDVTRLSAKPRKQPMGLSLVQLKQLLAFLSYDQAAAAEDIVDVIRLLAATGMRIGEALALEWDAVDLQRGTVQVRSTVIRLRGTGLIIKPTPKSTAGDRTLLLPSWTVTMLKKRKTRSHTSLVLPSQLGHLRDPSNTRRSMRRAFARAGYAGLTSHVFRKSLGTLLLKSGRSPVDAADQLGHGDPSLTLRVYADRTIRETGASLLLEELGYG